jgi:membrane-bound ClpP family serine protease
LNDFVLPKFGLVGTAGIATAAAGTITAATPVPESPSAAPTAAVTVVVAIVLGGCFTAWFAGFGPALSRCPALA